jgi:CspA family cold shock protein
MTTGTIRWINESKGFGLITPDDGGSDLFARFWALPAGDQSKSVRQKQKVSFDVQPGSDSDQAVNIKVLPT